jgi:hypothetical protein
MRTFIFAALAVLTLATTLPAEAKHDHGKHRGRDKEHEHRVYPTRRVYVQPHAVYVQSPPVLIIQPVRPTVTLTF